MDFVTFEIAKKLNEKGFREECFARYHCGDKAYFGINSYHPDTESIFYCYNNDEDLGRFYIDAPTIEQVLNWLRKEKKIYVSIEVEREDWFEYKIVQTTKNTRCNSTRVYETYDDAMIEGIKYVLYNLI